MDLNPVWLSIKLATVTTLVLIVIGTPLAWWLARGRSWWRAPVEALVILPVVLPPTVLGFYLIVLLGRTGPLSSLFTTLGMQPIFSFTGLVVGSAVFSLPFVVYPLKNSFEKVARGQLEAAAMLGAGPLDRFFSIVVPASTSGFIAAAVLAFAHTIGEFGVVLMVGGNIPGETEVLSIAIYNHVEQLQYRAAHLMSAGLVAMSFLVLLVLYLVNHERRGRLPI
jgi:molybdate transport system permease protein